MSEVCLCYLRRRSRRWERFVVRIGNPHGDWRDSIPPHEES